MGPFFFNPPSDCDTVIIPFYRWGSWGSESLVTTFQTIIQIRMPQALCLTNAPWSSLLGSEQFWCVRPLAEAHHLDTTFKTEFAASLVAQWLRIRLPIQGTWVRALAREDPTCHGVTKPVRHNYWAHVPQLLKPEHLEPVLCNKRSHDNEKPEHRNQE